MSNQNIIISDKVDIGIIDAEFPVDIETTIESVKSQVDGPIHFVDYCAWKGTEEGIRSRLAEEGWEIDDHHNCFATLGYLTATSSVKTRQDKGLIQPLERRILTFRPNFDGDLIFATILALNSGVIYRDLVEKTAVFSDCTMFGGRAFDPTYRFEKPEQTLAFAVSQMIYDETVKNFPKELFFLKGFPANKPRIAEAVLRGYENIMLAIPSICEQINQGSVPPETLEKASQYLNRVQSVYTEAYQRGQQLIPNLMVYLDMREGKHLDKQEPMPFWLAEGNGQFTINQEGGITPLILRETGTGYVLASADTRAFQGNQVPYDLTRVSIRLSELSGTGWNGKDTVLFGSRGSNEASPEKIAKVVKETYGL